MYILLIEKDSMLAEPLEKVVGQVANQQTPLGARESLLMAH
jgi:hypothetical protein